MSPLLDSQSGWVVGNGLSGKDGLYGTREKGWREDEGLTELWSWFLFPFLPFLQLSLSISSLFDPPRVPTPSWFEESELPGRPTDSTFSSLLHYESFRGGGKEEGSRNELALSLPFTPRRSTRADFFFSYLYFPTASVWVPTRTRSPTPSPKDESSRRVSPTSFALDSSPFSRSSSFWD